MTIRLSTVLVDRGPVEPDLVDRLVDRLLVDLLCTDEAWVAREFAALVESCDADSSPPVVVRTEIGPGAPGPGDPSLAVPVASSVEFVRAGLRIGRQRAPPGGCEHRSPVMFSTCCSVRR
jgi:hypothetical protein